MMVPLLPLLVPVALAAPRVQSTFELPEITVSTELAVRPNFRSTAGIAATVNLARSPRFDLETGLQVVAPATHLFQPGLGRQVWSVDALADALYTPSRFVGMGPTVALGVRTFSQQQWDVATRPVPMAGGRVRLYLVDGPRVRLGMHVRVLADLVSTRLLLGTATIFEFAGVGVQTGLTLGFGSDHRVGRGA